MPMVALTWARPNVSVSGGPVHWAITSPSCVSPGRPAAESRLRETDIAVHVVHPGRVRAFCYEAKTDPLDAQL